MPTAAVTGLSGYHRDPASSSSATQTKPGTVGKDDFLKLLTPS